MLSLVSWAYEIMILEAGYLSVEIQASQVILVNLVAIIYMIAIGM